MSQVLLSLAELEAYQEHRRPQRSGERLRYYCPIHGSDNQASLSVDPNTGAYHCFACGARGYLEEHKREWLEEKRRACLRIGSGASSGLDPGTWAPSGGQGNKNGAMSSHGTPINAQRNTGAKVTGPAKSTQNPSLRQAQDRVVNHPSASNEPQARPGLVGLLRELQVALPGSRGEEYLRQRGISLELAQALGLGYAAPGRWPHQGRDWKWGRLVFPHTHPVGEVVNLYGRAIGSNESVPKEKRHDHLPQPKGIFNARALLVAETVFVCEGVFDALSLMAAGTLEDGWAACAIFGVDGLRWEWIRARRIVFCFDRDEAGKRWRELAWQGIRQGREISFLTAEAYAGHKDLNETWMATGKIEIGAWEGRHRTPLPRWVDDDLAPKPDSSPASEPLGKTGGALPWGLGPGQKPAPAASSPTSAVVARESLQREDSSSFWMKADETCSRCAGHRAWRSIHGVITCATCHPPASPELVAEWIEGSARLFGGAVP